MINKIKELRRELHKYPELSGKEKETAKRIRNFVEIHNKTEIVEGIGGNGLAAIYSFSNQGPVIVIRCELDALPIQDKSSQYYRSVHNGVSHSCGHDGHMTIVAGLIFWIKEQSFDQGKIILLFQPSEETGKGANDVLNDPKFKALKPDYIFALHNIPGEPLHTILTKENSYTATVQSLAIYLTGRESHASEPEQGINPAKEIAEIIKEFESLNYLDPRSDKFSLITLIHMKLGQKAYGISAGSAELHYTIRTWSEEEMDGLKAEIHNIITTVCGTRNLKFKIEWFDYFPRVINDSFCNTTISHAAKENNFELKEMELPFKFGEDYGWFTRNNKAAMFGIGAGVNSPALHNPEYDFPDELIETGISMFKSIINSILNENLVNPS